MRSIWKRSGRYQAQVRRQGVQAVSRTLTTKKVYLIKLNPANHEKLVIPKEIGFYGSKLYGLQSSL